MQRRAKVVQVWSKQEWGILWREACVGARGGSCDSMESDVEEKANRQVVAKHMEPTRSIVECNTT